MFRPEVEGRRLSFSVVGAQYYNAIIEDDATRSWWYQATGVAITGPMKGQKMPVIPSEIMPLRQWLILHPDSLIFLPDPASEEAYEHFDGYSELRWDGEEPRRADGKMWEWIVGVTAGSRSRAYPWSAIDAERPLQDELGDVPLVIHLREDGISFRCWDRRLQGKTLDFRLDEEQDLLIDVETGSTFGFDGQIRNRQR